MTADDVGTASEPSVQEEINTIAEEDPNEVTLRPDVPVTPQKRHGGRARASCGALDSRNKESARRTARKVNPSTNSRGDKHKDQKRRTQNASSGYWISPSKSRSTKGVREPPKIVPKSSKRETLSSPGYSRSSTGRSTLKDFFNITSWSQGGQTQHGNLHARKQRERP